MIATIMAPCWEAAGAALPDAAPVAAEAALPAAHPVAAAAPAQPVAGPTVLAAATATSRAPEGDERPVPAAADPTPGDLRDHRRVAGRRHAPRRLPATGGWGW